MSDRDYYEEKMLIFGMVLLLFIGLSIGAIVGYNVERNRTTKSFIEDKGFYHDHKHYLVIEQEAFNE